MGPACASRLLANDEGGRRAGTEVQMAKSINFLCWWDSKLKATRDGGFGRGGGGGEGWVSSMKRPQLAVGPEDGSHGGWVRHGFPELAD